MTIPNRAFAFWGNDKMSWCRYMTLYSLRKLNPELQIDLYTTPQNDLKKVWDCDVQQDFFMFEGDDYTHLLKHLDINIVPWTLKTPTGQDLSRKIAMSQQSNFLKYEILAKEGGFYVDLDILWTKSLKKYAKCVENADFALCTGNGYFSIGFLASRAPCAFFQEVWEHAFKYFYCESYQGAGVEVIYDLLKVKTGIKDVFMLRRDLPGYLRDLWPDLTFYDNPFKLVYPWPHDAMGHVWLDNHEELPTETIGIHWYAGAPISQLHNGSLTENSTEECTYMTHARKLL